MMDLVLKRTAALLLVGFLGIQVPAFPQGKTGGELLKAIDTEVQALMRTGNIPGLSLVFIKGGQPMIRNYGYADRETRKPVSSNTLFELGSCSKAFTALAVAQLQQEGRLQPDDPVARYLPWFRVSYKDTPVTITIRQLLHHTSGIPWSTISKIPQTNEKDALVRTVKQLEGQALNRLPGKKYEYATINYDVLALIIQVIAKEPFEQYLQENIIDKLGLAATTIGYPGDPLLKASGYKVGFFAARPFRAPVFRGNNAAGYVNSNIKDISRWLQFQMGLTDTGMYPLARFTHQRDEAVPLHFMSSYAMGWDVSLSGNGEIYHDGTNPNFTAFLAFRTKDSLGVALLANSNSTYTPVIGNKVMKLLAGEKIEKEYDPGDSNDKVFSVASFILAGYLLVLMTFLGKIIAEIVKGARKREGPYGRKLYRLAALLIGLLPFLYGFYILPMAIYDFNWQAIMVWTPVSFSIALTLLIAALVATYLVFGVSQFFPEIDKFRKMIPRLLVLSISSGLANMLLILLITSSLESTVELKYLVFYYVLTFSVYLLGRRFLQVYLITFTMGVIYDLRVKIIDRIFATSYQQFEKVDKGLVYTAMNDDVGTIGESTNMFVVLATSFFTAAGALLYLASIAFWATVLTFSLMLLLTLLYYVVSKSTNRYYEEARDTRNDFIRLIAGMIDGFKELSLHRNKRKEYTKDMADSANDYREKMSTAGTRFVNASLVGEAVLIVILGAVVFAFPKVFPGIKIYTLMSFVIVLLYLIGPITTILNSVPAVMRLRIALNRIKGFLSNMPSGSAAKQDAVLYVSRTVESIRAEGVRFRYKSDQEQDLFEVGPVDLEIGRGEIVFIIGGNGSGKTTLAKLLSGLYVPDGGEFKINGEPVDALQLSEHFSTVFSPMYLFEKLYDIDLRERHEEVKRYLKLLNLDRKVEIKGNTYNTINLSGGQRKRLGLLQCYLEDRPVYLFDEWAADQDPDYRKFFYRTLLPEMKMKGKIIIAITHDDHYFDVADKVYKMQQGQLEDHTERYLRPEDIINERI